MRRKFLVAMIALGATTALVLLMPAAAIVRASGQGAQARLAPGSANETWATPRTAWGHPDLQGVWTNKTITPFERPAALADKEFLTPEEAAALEAASAEDRAARDAPLSGDADLETVTRRVGQAYNNFWWDRGTDVVATMRTSLVIDPPNGRVPSTPAGAARLAAASVRGTDSWKDRSLYERCIIRHSLPASMSPTAYNSNYQIFQTPEYVVVQIEMVPHTRIIPLDGRPHVAEHLRLWMGDSRGRWEGDTLVVETTNFNDKFNYRGANERLHFVERFTRVSPDVIDYRFTVTDPTSFTRPWTAAIPMVREPNPIYEYACHEGNYGMEGILAGARAEEKAAGDAARK